MMGIGACSINMGNYAIKISVKTFFFLHVGQCMHAESLAKSSLPC